MNRSVTSITLRDAVITALLGLGFAQATAAAEIPVPDSGDVFRNGANLIAAIDRANSDPGDDVIVLGAGVHYVLDRANNSADLGPNGLPTIRSGVTIQGDFDATGSPSTIRRQSTNDFRLLFVTRTGRLRLESLRVSGGYVTLSSWPEGGGIFNNGGEVELLQVDVSGNEAFVGGGIVNQNHYRMTSPSSEEFREGRFVIEASSVRNNRTTRSAGALSNRGYMRIERSTISGNQGDDTVGGIGSGNQIPTITEANLELINSTVTGNRTIGPHRLESGGLAIGGRATISFSTVSYNTGIGIDVRKDATVVVSNSIVNGNVTIDTGPLFGADCRGALTSRGHNLIGISNALGCTVSPHRDDRLGTTAAPLDARVESLLADHGGFTQTLALRSDSPAIRGASNARGGCPAIDQRGQVRPGYPDACDIGAFQLPYDSCAANPWLCTFQQTLTVCLKHEEYCRKAIAPKIRNLMPQIPALDPRIPDCLLDGPGCWDLPYIPKK